MNTKIDCELYQLLLSLRVGDGCYRNQRKIGTPTYNVMTNGVNHDYIDYKAYIFERNGFTVRRYKSKSGYGSPKIQSGVRTHVEPEITLVGRMNLTDVVSDLNLTGLILFYLDDGSLHKTKHFMNLYCYSLNDEQRQIIVDKFYELFPVKRCSILIDRKRDGRQFKYISMPKAVASEFSVHVRKFLIENNIQSLLYKTIPPSQTIESIE